MIIEEYTGDPKKRLDNAKVFPTKKRAIFNIVENSQGREYKYVGVFKVEGDNDKRVWKMEVNDNCGILFEN